MSETKYGTGTIKRIMSKGYGFITLEDGKDIFFHAANVDGIFEDMIEGQKVEFDIKPSQHADKGDNAFNVRVIN